MTRDEYEQYRADCFNKSVGSLNKSDGYDCPKCLNRGLFAESVKDSRGYYYVSYTYCKCTKIRKSISSLNRSGLKEVIGKYRFDSFETAEEWQKTIKDRAVEFSKSGERLFFIGGQSGCGKSHLCTAICRELILDGKEVKYLLWRDYASRMKSYYDDEDSDRLKELCKTVDVLYVDDMFKTGVVNGDTQKPTIADINIAFELINSRYLNPNLITIISSESTLRDIISIDEAIGGRIKELAKEYCLSINKDTKKNYRLKDMIEL